MLGNQTRNSTFYDWIYDILERCNYRDEEHIKWLLDVRGKEWA